MSVKERRIRRTRWPKWFIALMLIVVVYSGGKLVQQQLTLNSLSDDRAVAEARLKEAQEVNASLEQENQQLQDPDYVERMAREDLGMTRQGEMPYIYNHKEK